MKMKLVIVATLATLLNLVSAEIWAGDCSVSVANIEQKPVFGQSIKASEEDKNKKKKNEGGSEDDEPDCDD